MRNTGAAADRENPLPSTNPADLQYLLDQIEVDNYFDYMIFEAFFANTDTGNIRYYKLPGEKWRWIIYDMDLACSTPRPTASGTS